MRPRELGDLGPVHHRDPVGKTSIASALAARTRSSAPSSSGPSRTARRRARTEGTGGRLGRLMLRRLAGMVRVGQHRQRPQTRQQLPHELDPLLRHLERQEGAAGEVPSRPRQALRDAERDRVAADGEQDGLAGRRPHRQDGRAARHDQIGGRQGAPAASPGAPPDRPARSGGRRRGSALRHSRAPACPRGSRR